MEISCHNHVISCSMSQMISSYHFFFNITTINYCDIALSIYDLTSVCYNFFNVYFYYYSFYLVIFSFVCNTIYVSGNTNKQSLLSMLTAIKHFLSSSEYYCVPPRGGAG